MQPTESPFVRTFRRLVDPMLAVFVLVLATLLIDRRFSGDYLILSIITFFIASQVFDDAALLRSCARGERWLDLTTILTSWALVVGLILFIGFAAKVSDVYSRLVMVTWFAATPVVLYAAHRIARTWIRQHRLRGNLRSAVIIGANPVGARLAQRIDADPCLMLVVEGFFDDRARERIAPEVVSRMLGRMEDVAAYVKRHRVHAVYIAIALNRSPRMQRLLAALRDTTVSIYFAPDVFVDDLMQARVETLGGVPVIGIRETPFVSINAFSKRALDIVLTLLLLPLLAPVMLTIAIGIKLTSTGLVLFRQRRYGLGGEEIYVYKFRTMTVLEDGAVVPQATRRDRRITPFGAFLRRTSLDELPQFINVLQGRMSIVGPRPHAVAHNEQYRGLISGYMIRHKVKPGITGWAQVNGLRGETETVDKMERRVRYDLDYLSHWSLSFDLRIIMRTAGLLLRGGSAY